MAVRFDAEADAYKATTGLPSGAAWTITCWVYVSVDRNATSTPWSVANTTTENTGTASSNLATEADGTSLLAYRDFNMGMLTGAPNLTVAGWYQTGVAKNGTTVNYSWGLPGAPPTTTTNTDPAAAITPAALYIGRSVWNSEWWNGRVAAFKMWDAELTSAQVAAELAQFTPVRTAGLLRYHPFHVAETTDYSGNGNNLSGGSGTTTEAGPSIRWGSRGRNPRVSITPRQPTVDAGKDVFGTAGFEFNIQAVETGIGITDRSWTVVSGPAEVATEIGATSLLSWFPATPGVYELEYRITNPAGQAYDTVYATVNATGTIVNSASTSGTGTTLTCNKPTGTAESDVMLAVQSGDFNDLDLMTSPLPWQPLFEYDVGFDTLHIKGWTLTAGASEPSSYGFTQGTGSAGTVTIVAMRGVVEAGVRFEIVPDTGTTATRTCPTVEGAVDGSILLCGAMTDPGAARTWTPPSGMTEQADTQSGTATTHSVASLLDPPDPTGAKSFTLSGATVAPGGIQWSAVFPMPPDPQRRGANKSMFTVVRTL